MTLTERMRTFADDVTSTRADRVAAVARSKKETEQMLNGARARIKQTACEHRKMAKQLQADLASNCKDRLRHVHSLREQTRCELRDTRARLRQMLHQDKADRKRHLANLMQSFQQTRRMLTGDLRQASNLWRQTQSEQAGK